MLPVSALGQNENFGFQRETHRSCPPGIRIAHRPRSWQLVGGKANGGFHRVSVGEGLFGIIAPPPVA
jgi:hypothetical protein